MRDVTTYRSIGNSVSYRSQLLTELGLKLAEQEKLDHALRKRLLEKAPKELRLWLAEDCILSDLFKFGRCSRKIRFGEYNFRDVADTRTKISLLRKVWNDVVSIELDKNPEPHRIEVSFSALL